MKKFALIGAAGFIAPRHMKAIKESGNVLVAALDKHDNVGILDSYFPEADFFTEFERFDRHLDKLKRRGEQIDYISICSPNYLHDAHVRYTLRYGANAICEKPIVLNPWNLDGLRDIEVESGKKVFTILQLRHHPSIVALRENILRDATTRQFDVTLKYVTSRGNWYRSSWKGDISKSGGVSTNIGIHFFDMLIWLFGSVRNSHVTAETPESAQGELTLERANVRWFLSIDKNDLPSEALQKGSRTFRSITINGTELEFSDGFTDLHTISYRAILDGKGFSLMDAKPSIDLVHSIRTKT